MISPPLVEMVNRGLSIIVAKLNQEARGIHFPWIQDDFICKFIAVRLRTSGIRGFPRECIFYGRVPFYGHV